MKNIISKIRPAWLACLLLMSLLITQIDAQTYTPLHIFTNTPDGGEPFGGLALSGNTLYGTTSIGGTNGNGCIFSVQTSGTAYKELYAFAASKTFHGTNADGEYPKATLLLLGNTLYGTTAYGGTNGYGTIFSIQTNGQNFTVLYNFSPVSGNNQVNTDGANPQGGLVWSGSALYGTTYYGGGTGNGTVFSINTNGSNFTPWHSFATLIESGGSNPSQTMQIAGGVLYGTTEDGGINGAGTVFSISTNGQNFNVLHNFSQNEGQEPEGVILYGSALYGVTDIYGTNSGSGSTLEQGTIFSIGTNSQNFTVLHAFTDTTTDGSNPFGELTVSNGILYGTTQQGGSNYFGTVFSISTNGSAFTILYNFPDTGTNSDSPVTGVVLSGDVLYGTAYIARYGDVFSLQLPLPPPVITSITHNSASSVTISFLSAPASTNVVQASASLSAPTWSNLSTNVAASDGTWQFTDTAITGYPTRFYRAFTF